MHDKVYAAIKGWAGIFTWHTSHALDEARFHEAMVTMHNELGESVSEGDLRRALRKHRDENPESLGGKPSDSQLEEHVKKAMAVLAHLKNQGG